MTYQVPSPRGALLPVAFACLTLLASAASAQTTAPPPSAKPSKSELAAQLASTLQACSYDGSPVRFSPPDLSKGGTTGTQVVAEIMRYTGLPANFVVVEGKVPNAAAIIMLDDLKVPRRVIAYNTEFMGEVIRATKANNWAPVSIMAHEIAHHLSGHTIVPGGSQPPIELESDKFSGFVLYKMGAPLSDAQRAIATLIPEADGPTHPGRRKRLAAIAAGWKESCQLQGADDCSGAVHPGAATAAGKKTKTDKAANPAQQPASTVAQAPSRAQAPTAAPAQAATHIAHDPVPAGATKHTPVPAAAAKHTPAPAVIAQHAPATAAAAPQNPAPDVAAKTVAAPQSIPPTLLATAAPNPPMPAGHADTLPRPDAQAIPSKGTQFIYDEFGFLDLAVRAAFEKQMFEHAQTVGVEIVTLLVKDLGGLSAQDYAFAMMRQLRVGKLDVGNGAVLVVAPNQQQAAVAFGPGVALEMGNHDKAGQLKNWIGMAWKACQAKGACGNWTENLLLAADHIRRDTQAWDWTTSYSSLGDLQQMAALESGKNVPPQQSKVWRKIVQLSGTVENLAPAPGNKAAWVIESKLNKGQTKAVLLRSSEGLATMLYVDARTEALMPGGKLEQGKKYVLVARESGVTRNPQDTQALDLLSYALAE